MSTFINRDLPNDEYQAAVGANNPSSANVFATMADILAGTGDAERLIFNVKISQIGGINKGQAVYVSGANGTNILVSKADYSTEATSSKTLGLLVASGADNAFGQVIANGILKGTGSAPLDTSAAGAGDPVWLGDDGNLIYGLANKPYAPNHLVFLGIVVESNPTVGEIFVKVQNGFELKEIHDVDLISTPPQNADVLTFNSVTGLWESKPIPGVSSGGTQLLSGGASWSDTGMVFNVSTLTYTIDGDYYTSSPTNVTLAVGDLTNPRFDAIVVDAAGVVSVIQGTPSANPIVPPIPGTQVLVQYVLVGAGQVTPSITNEYVYREGATPDWTQLFVAGGGTYPLQVDYSSTSPVPFLGLTCASVKAPTYASKYIYLTKPSGSISRAAFPFLSFRVNLPVALPSRNIIVRLFNGTSYIGLTYASSYGFNPSSAGSWQLVVIPVSVFGNPAQLNITRVEFWFTGATLNTFGVGRDVFAFDDIKFQSGYGGQTSVATIDILDSGVVVGPTAKLNFIDGTNTTAVVTQDIANNRIDVKIDSATAANIYNSDGALTANRTLTGGNFDLLFDALRLFGVNLVPGGGINGYTINVDTNGMSGSLLTRIFKIEDTFTGTQRFGINRNGNVIFNNSFEFPLGDGLVGQTLITNGAGTVEWTFPVTTKSFFDQFMVNQYSYFLPSDNSALFDTLRAGGSLTSVGTTSSLTENPMGVLFTTPTAVSSVAALFGNTFGGSILGVNFQFETYRRFRINTANPAQRLFIGISSLYSATTPTNIDPISQINSIGVCKTSTSNNLFLMWNDATGTASSLDTGFTGISNSFTYTLRIFKTFGVASVTIELTQITNSTGATTIFSTTITSDYNTGVNYFPVAWMGNSTTSTGAVSYKDYGCTMTKRNIITA